ncbi:Por secretion system C-terminal sorting domain-containing protein [Tangfeifania diversioriginum]|uniref:Por secretion system C-terminal sorting domain-containing protein n=1 Tax=Tangfeifania diversioriginum TaxID=1168035 RepID=A0A1M6IN96_9BACT|nr:T9SS type A sorting domain-containing protein [Tangfeifania diversioriginum]SHJ35823.1 Por secretion system C-terminal sorting domain-containing protein [Tangfeifania diversioriginum]
MAKTKKSGRRQTLLTCLLLTFWGFIPSSAQNWVPVGAEGFSEGETFSQSIAFIGETPYVAYMDRTHDDKATVMKFNEEEWEVVGSAGFTPGKANSLCFAISGNTPYVAFCDVANGRKASVMKFDGTDWVFVGGPGITENIADEVSLAIENGTLWLAFQDAVQNSKITVIKNGGEGWATVGTPGFSTGFMTNVIDIAVENGTPYVSYRDYGANYRASVMKYNSASSAWEVLGQQGFSASTHDAYQCLAVYNNTPYLATRGTDAKATLYKFDGSGWVPLGTDGLSKGTAFYPTVKFAPNGVPHIAFSDDGEGEKATLMKYTETGWEQVGEVASKSGADYTSLAFSASGVPHLAFRDHWKLRRTTVVKYANTTSVKAANTNEMTFRVYPNPNTGTFTIELPQKAIHGSRVEITDLNGKTIFSKKMNTSTIQTIDLPPNVKGFYLVKLSGNGTVSNQSIIIN